MTPFDFFYLIFFLFIQICIFYLPSYLMTAAKTVLCQEIPRTSKHSRQIQFYAIYPVVIWFPWRLFPNSTSSLFQSLSYLNMVHGFIIYACAFIFFCNHFELVSDHLGKIFSYSYHFMIFNLLVLMSVTI